MAVVSWWIFYLKFVKPKIRLTTIYFCKFLSQYPATIPTHFLKKFSQITNRKNFPTRSIITIQEEEEDSDLASIAREFQDDDSDNIFESPFIKKPNQPKIRHASDNTTPLPERKFSFISSAPKVCTIENYCMCTCSLFVEIIHVIFILLFKGVRKECGRISYSKCFQGTGSIHEIWQEILTFQISKETW